MAFTAAASSILPELVRLRRSLHREPEVGIKLPRTQQKVLAALEGLDLEITTGTETTSVVAVLRGANPGPAVLLRGDMDALPVHEETGLAFAATNGAMHACGHDLHASGLVGAAKLLAARRDEMFGNVIFMFQPGEEGAGGAAIMLQEGLLEAAQDKPEAAYAIHVAPGRAGVFHSRSGPMLAGANELHITIRGAGGHGSKPESAVDPVPGLLETADALQTMVTRRFSVFDPVVLTVTQLRAGEAINVIPDSASLGATVRALSQESVDTLIIETKRLAEGIAAAHQCSADVRLDVKYPVTVNDAEKTEVGMNVLRGVFGEDRVEVSENPAMGSEDFSYVLNEVPGALFMLTCSPPDVDQETMAYNHSPRVLFDDAILGDHAAALAELGWSHVGQHAR